VAARGAGVRSRRDRTGRGSAPPSAAAVGVLRRGGVRGGGTRAGIPAGPVSRGGITRVGRGRRHGASRHRLTLLGPARGRAGPDGIGAVGTVVAEIVVAEIVAVETVPAGVMPAGIASVRALAVRGLAVRRRPASAVPASAVPARLGGAARGAATGVTAVVVRAGPHPAGAVAGGTRSTRPGRGAVRAGLARIAPLFPRRRVTVGTRGQGSPVRTLCPLLEVLERHGATWGQRWSFPRAYSPPAAVDFDVGPPPPLPPHLSEGASGRRWDSARRPDASQLRATFRCATEIRAGRTIAGTDRTKTNTSTTTVGHA